MDRRERGGITGTERAIVEGISALHAGTQNAAIQQLVQHAREAIADFYLEADEQIPVEAIENMMLDLAGQNPIRRREILTRALRHTKGVLVGQKKSPERDQQLGIISERLSRLHPESDVALPFR